MPDISKHPVCKACDHIFTLGEGVVTHVFEKHPRIFVAAILNSDIGKQFLRNIYESVLDKEFMKDLED